MISSTLLVVGMASGGVFTVISIFVLHSYEKRLGKRPPSFNFWPFFKELKDVYPDAAKVGAILEVVSMTCIVAYLAVNFVGKQ